MQTSPPYPPDDTSVITAYEACAVFAADAAGSEVCGACGWLDAEHDHLADVRVLPERAEAHPAPKRLAS
ncbi:MAG TPA: hypothetical protein VL119_05100 [Acidimicrobiia bacterium]|nr:hypothetical protein [Acidimicrobiia bacterium]